MDQCPQGHLWWGQQKSLSDHSGLWVLPGLKGLAAPNLGLILAKKAAFLSALFHHHHQAFLLRGLLLASDCPSVKSPFFLGRSPHCVNLWTSQPHCLLLKLDGTTDPSSHTLADRTGHPTWALPSGCFSQRLGILSE